LYKIKRENKMVRRLKYKVVNPDTNRTMHHSYNKKNAEEWVDNNIRNRRYRIKKINR
jgi:hypothetical protein